MRGFICVLGFMLVMVAWPAQAVVLFEDQFDSSLDTSKWDQVRSTGSGSGYVYGTGSTVTESGGVLTVSQAATDNGGGVVTKPIDIADEGVVTVTMRSYVHYHNTNFSGQSILLGDDGHFLNRIFHSRYNSLNAFYPDYPSSSYPSVPPTWNNWIIGTLTHDPASGESTYKYLFDGTETALISHTNYGPGVVVDDNIRLMLLSWGWFTGHYTSYGYVIVEQDLVGDVPLPAPRALLVIGAVGLVRRAR